MADLADGEQTEVVGSGKAPYVLRNVGGVFSCSCPAWRNQAVPIERRTCKHLKGLRGEDIELARVGVAGGASGGPGAVVASSAPKAASTGAKCVPPLLPRRTWWNDG